MDKILRAALAAIEAVKGQVFPVVADETASGAYLVYRNTKTTPLAALDGDTGCAFVNYDIHSIADKYSTCQEVMDAASAICSGLAGTTDGGVDIQSVDIINQSPQEWNQDMGAYVSILSISCFISKK